MDKAGPKFWNDLWADGNIPKAVDPADTRILNTVNRQFDREFRRLFDKSRTPSMKLLEVGCGKSAWLPYFAKEFGFKVYGLDYSPNGCEMARKVLRANAIDAQIVQADLFSPPRDMLGAFDVVVSFGLVEHFDHTASCVGAISAFLKPGGLLITSIPNMVGWIGSIQKAFNRPIYDVHELIDPARLKEAHRRAALDVLDCDYFMSTNFGVCNLTGVSTRTPTGFMKKVFFGVLMRVSMLIWFIERNVGAFRANRLTSPYINCVARRR